MALPLGGTKEKIAEQDITSEPERNDLGINFLSNNEQMMQLNRQGRWESSDCNENTDSPLNVVYDSNDSVYEPSQQIICKQQHPLLRAHKLTKRIRRDKRISPAMRKALKTRRNIITFRIRQKRNQMDEELQLRVIPQLQAQVSEVKKSIELLSQNFVQFKSDLALTIFYAQLFDKTKLMYPNQLLAIPLGFNEEEGRVGLPAPRLKIQPTSVPAVVSNNSPAQSLS